MNTSPPTKIRYIVITAVSLLSNIFREFSVFSLNNSERNYYYYFFIVFHFSPVGM